MNKERLKRECQERRFDTTFHQDGGVTIKKTASYRSLHTAVSKLAKEVRHLQQVFKQEGFASKKGKRSVNQDTYSISVRFDKEEGE